MAGVYIHIPFCKKKCHYCDFYSITEHKYVKIFLQSLLKEIEFKKNYLGNENVNTIYIGGGTPSLLKEGELKLIFKKLKKVYKIDNNVEITIEVNPDDVNDEYVKAIKNCGINRVSIGVQSFDDKVLKFLNRRHNAFKAEEAIKICMENGIDNISVDLIYGIPGMDILQWEQTMEKIKEFKINHISAYHLSFEKGTVLYHNLLSGIINKLKEEESLIQMEALFRFARNENYEHYEISNFAKKGYYSVHNSNYWKQGKYIGFGPSAHSYNTKQRHWNVSDINEYLNRINKGEEFYESEELSLETKYNEYVMTSLRTSWGVNTDYILNHFGEKYFQHFWKTAKKYSKQEKISVNKEIIILSEKGKYIADRIILDFFIVGK
ncbi:radical SAM family heme chaperone HemW [Bacteroidota bacterium]